jgi:hypothetical protein
MTNGGDNRALQFESIFQMRAGRLVGNSSFMKRPEEPVATSVPGEHPPRPIGAMGGRRKPDDESTRPGIAEAGNRSTPVFFELKRPSLLDCHLLAPLDQPGTAFAGNEAVI